MSLAAVTAANAAPTWTQEPAHETTDRGAGSKFAALLSTLENETTKVEASSKGASADGRAPHPPRRAAKRPKRRVSPRSRPRSPVWRTTRSAAAPMRLRPAPPPRPRRRPAARRQARRSRARRRNPMRAPPSPRRPPPSSARARGERARRKRRSLLDCGEKPRRRRQDGQRRDRGFQRRGADRARRLRLRRAGRRRVRFVAPAATTIGAPLRRRRAMRTDPRGESSSGATSAVSAAALAKGGAADSATSTLRDILGGDSSLFVSSVESRTYLGLDVASSALAAATAAVAARGDERRRRAARGARLDRVDERERAGDRKARQRGRAARRRAASPPPPRRASPSPRSPANRRPPSRGIRRPAAIRAAAALRRPSSATSASATSAASDLAGGFSASVSLDQLPAVIADAAEELSAAAQSASGSAAAGASNAQPVKELQINLAPAELGSLQVTMRLADGKLSVVVEVAKTSTLQAIAGDRDAIAARLGSASAPLEFPCRPADARRRDRRRRLEWRRAIRNPGQSLQWSQSRFARRRAVDLAARRRGGRLAAAERAGSPRRWRSYCLAPPSRAPRPPSFASRKWRAPRARTAFRSISSIRSV